MKKINSKYFIGNKISDYGLEHKRVDYGTLAKSFDCVLANELADKRFMYCELVNGSEKEDGEIFQFNIISYEGYQILSTWTDEIIYYDEEFDIYIWGVTHFGANWDYVLTDIEVEI